MALWLIPQGRGCALLLSDKDAPEDHAELEAYRTLCHVPKRAYQYAGTRYEALLIAGWQIGDAKRLRAGYGQMSDVYRKCASKGGYVDLPPEVEYE